MDKIQIPGRTGLTGNDSCHNLRTLSITKRVNCRCASPNEHSSGSKGAHIRLQEDGCSMHKNMFGNHALAKVSDVLEVLLLLKRHDVSKYNSTRIYLEHLTQYPIPQGKVI